MTQLIERPPWSGDAEPDEPRRPATAVTVSMVQAINRALRDAMTADDRVLVFGEDVAKLGGVFRVTDGLHETFGEARCFDTPLAESAIVGIAIGMAIHGMVPRPLKITTSPMPAHRTVESDETAMRDVLQGAW